MTDSRPRVALSSVVPILLTFLPEHLFPRLDRWDRSRHYFCVQLRNAKRTGNVPTKQFRGVCPGAATESVNLSKLPEVSFICLELVRSWACRHSPLRYVSCWACSSSPFLFPGIEESLG